MTTNSRRMWKRQAAWDGLIEQQDCIPVSNRKRGEKQEEEKRKKTWAQRMEVPQTANHTVGADFGFRTIDSATVVKSSFTPSPRSMRTRMQRRKKNGRKARWEKENRIRMNEEPVFAEHWSRGTLRLCENRTTSGWWRRSSTRSALEEMMRQRNTRQRLEQNMQRKQMKHNKLGSYQKDLAWWLIL